MRYVAGFILFFLALGSTVAGAYAGYVIEAAPKDRFDNVLLGGVAAFFFVGIWLLLGSIILLLRPEKVPEDE